MWNRAQQQALLLENDYMDTAKVGYPFRLRRDSKGMQMTGEKGNKLARVIPEASLGEKLVTDPKLDSTSQKRIGDQLRAMYDELMQQPVPDRFKDLLDQLDKGSSTKTSKNDNGQEGSQ